MNSVAALLIFLLLRLPVPTSTHHIVFEEIGEMAGALSYIHAVIPVNISGLDRAANTFRSQIADLRRNYQVAQTKIDKTIPDSAQGQQLARDLKYQRQIQEGILQASEAEADNLLALLDNLKGTLPRVNEAPTLAMDDPHNFRIKRFIGGLLRGIFGTFMGLYNRRKMNNLRDQVETVAARQNRLLQVTEVSLQRLDNLESRMTATMRLLNENISITLAHRLLRSIYDQLHLQYQQIIRAVQAAHQRRLSVDLLNATRLQDLFQAAQIKAQINKCQLLLSHPSDLFQIEASYFYNGQDILLLLHIPMAPADSILRLFQFHPFPLPFTKTHFLLPKPSKPIFALSSGMERLSAELSMVNLMDCHKINSMHLCEEHGVLNKNLNSTCLGSLYQQDFAGAMALCDMEITTQKETVLPLRDNWYLVHSPRQFTGHITCRNFSNSEVFLKPGPNRFYISPSCRLQLADHLIISDVSLKLDNVIKHYEWELDKIAFTDEEEARSTEWLTILNDEKAGRTTLNAIRQALAAERRSPIWAWIFTFLALMLLLSLMVASGYLLATRYFWTLKARILKYMVQLLPEPVVRLLTPTTSPSAAAEANDA
jgi:Baculovirus F protein